MSSLKIPTRRICGGGLPITGRYLTCQASTAVVILCGDISRRLGVSKALLQANGKPLFKVVEENLSPLGLPVYLVSKVPFESGEFL